METGVVTLSAKLTRYLDFWSLGQMNAGMVTPPPGNGVTLARDGDTVSACGQLRVYGASYDCCNVTSCQVNPMHEFTQLHETVNDLSLERKIEARMFIADYCV